MRRRVVITGLGAITPVGVGVKAFWHALREGLSGIDVITLFDARPFPCQFAAEVKNFDPAVHFAGRGVARMGRFTQFAVVAARMAYDDAGLATTPRASRFGVSFGSAASAVPELQGSLERFVDRGMRAIPPSLMLESANHAATSHVAAALSLGGPSTTFASGCAAGIDAFQWAYDQVGAGLATGVLAGGTESPISSYIHAASCAARMCTQWPGPPSQALRPFDVLHDGWVLGEGAGAFVVEELDYARARGARIYAEVLGVGSASGIGGPGSADPTGLQLQAAVRRALHQARLDPTEVDYICAHGNALPAHDRAETAAYRKVFGRHAYSIPVSSIKPVTGQAFAAGSALQIVAGCFALAEQFVPATLNHDIADPACDLDYVSARGRPARVARLLVATSAIGPTYSAVVLGCAP
jgi:3-oxoacyl-[acyl-carrier-protein] synthase II